MKIEETKDLIKRLLDETRISAVYYIDDYLSFDGLNAIISFIESSTEEELKRYAALIPERFIETRTMDYDIRTKIQNWWFSLARDKQDEVIRVCINHNNPKAETRVQQLLGDDCLSCSPDEWSDKYSVDCLAKIKAGEKVLLLFDYKLGNTLIPDGEGRNGLGLAQQFGANEGVKENAYCGIFSQQIKIEGDEDEFHFRKRYKDQLESWAFPLSKERLSDDGDGARFVEGLNFLLWARHVDALSEVAQGLINTTSKRLRDAFGDILPLEFKQLVINSSDVEGSREIDTILRLMHIVFDRELHQALTNMADGFASINKKVESIKAIDAVVKKKLSSQYDSNMVKGFFQDENFIKGEVINNLLMPLQNGDVFCVNDKDFYVLLCQPCNIAIRTGGKRGGNDIGYFVPLEEVDIEESLSNKLDNLRDKEDREWDKAKEKSMGHLHKKMGEIAQGYAYHLKCSIDGRYLCMVMNKYMTISLSLLDYCTFSEDGMVTINKDPSPNLHPNQQSLHNNHQEVFKSRIDIESLVEGLPSEACALIRPKVETWYYSLLTKLRIKPRFESARYIFPIKRYGHIQEPLSSDLLTQLSHYMSRAGLPNKFD